MLWRIVGVITGGIALAAGVRIMIVQFADPRGAQSFAIGMGAALLIGGAAGVTTSLRPRR
jgi:hypothetical protein